MTHLGPREQEDQLTIAEFFQAIETIKAQQAEVEKAKQARG